MRLSVLVGLLVQALALFRAGDAAEAKPHHHKHHHGHKRHHHRNGTNASLTAPAVPAAISAVNVGANQSETAIMDKLHSLEKEVAQKSTAEETAASAADSSVAAQTDAEDSSEASSQDMCQGEPCPPEPEPAPKPAGECPAPCQNDIDIDTEMPYGELEPFGREDTAQELTESSITESDEMVDQLERAEVAEEKRAVFRALTRLRGAAITSFDGIARSQTGNIDEYNKVHKWRVTHPLRHLADEESDITKWAFPDNADF